VIAKAIITIYAKLYVGFQKQPYLASFPPELMHELKEVKMDDKKTDKYIALLQ